MLSRVQLAVAASVGFMVMAAWLVFLKPDPAALLENSQRTQPAAIEKNISAAEALNSLQPMQVKKQESYLPDQSALQQRDRLYKEFEGISISLSQGQQPDARKVDELLQQQMQLVKSGGLSAQDAINYCEFLSKVMPEMDQQINRYIRQLEKL
ncbi:hypothetical protein [Acinetobacter sp. CWB-B33]|uniref:hypothetical protein n=1 Tax=Acinetobacter sp. CWB-B33 TaxID=2815724 RepID=UPI0031FE7C6E